MPRSESTKDHDKSCTELSIEDKWKECTMKYINNVKKAPSGGNWQITGGMFKGDKYHARRFFRIDEFYQECNKRPQFLELLNEYVAKNKDVQHIYNAIVTRSFKTSTDIHEVPSNQMSGTHISKATTSDMMGCDVMPES
eukprot:9201444-Ditylum_brightwellii.AAC.1